VRQRPRASLLIALPRARAATGDGSRRAEPDQMAAALRAGARSAASESRARGLPFPLFVWYAVLVKLEVHGFTEDEQLSTLRTRRKMRSLQERAKWSGACGKAYQDGNGPH
jgi:hypothetical protein